MVKDGTKVRDECAASVVHTSKPCWQCGMGPAACCCLLPENPRFAMFYIGSGPGRPCRVVVDNGRDVEIRLRVPEAFLYAPVAGLQYVVCRRSDGKWQVLKGSDCYMAMPTGDLMHTNDPNAQLIPLGLMKLGTWIPDKLFHEIGEAANEWRREQAEKDQEK